MGELSEKELRELIRALFARKSELRSPTFTKALLSKDPVCFYLLSLAHELDLALPELELCLAKALGELIHSLTYVDALLLLGKESQEEQESRSLSRALKKLREDLEEE